MGGRNNAHAWNGQGFTMVVTWDPARLHLRTHYAATCDGRTLQLFVNGRLVRRKTLPRAVEKRGFPITIGGALNSEDELTYPFRGLLESVRISKSRRYREERFDVPDSLESDDEMLALYDLTRGDAPELQDLSGNGHHGQTEGARHVAGRQIRRQAATGLAATGLAAQGDRAVPVLTHIVKTADPAIQVDTLVGIRSQSMPDGLRETVEALTESGSEEVRNAARETLATLQVDDEAN